jgi:hypothetical protein
METGRSTALSLNPRKKHSGRYNGRNFRRARLEKSFARHPPGETRAIVGRRIYAKSLQRFGIMPERAVRLWITGAFR